MPSKVGNGAAIKRCKRSRSMRLFLRGLRITPGIGKNYVRLLLSAKFYRTSSNAGNRCELSIVNWNEPAAHKLGKGESGMIATEDLFIMDVVQFTKDLYRMGNATWPAFTEDRARVDVAIIK